MKQLEQKGFWSADSFDPYDGSFSSDPLYLFLECKHQSNYKLMAQEGRTEAFRLTTLSFLKASNYYPELIAPFEEPWEY